MFQPGAQPSYSHGFATGPGESVAPWAWQDLVGAWVPALGSSGTGRIHNHAVGRSSGSHMVLRGGPSWRRGKKDGVSISGDGLDKYGDIDEASTSLLATDKPFTVCVTAVADAARAYMQLMGSINDWFAATVGFLLYATVAGDQMQFLVLGAGPDTVRVDPDTITLDKPIRWVGVYDGGNVYLYRDGELKASKLTGLVTYQPATTALGLMSIGNDTTNKASNSQWEGSVSSALLYRRAFTHEEVLEDYADPLRAFRRSTDAFSHAVDFPSAEFPWGVGMSHLSQPINEPLEVVGYE